MPGAGCWGEIKSRFFLKDFLVFAWLPTTNQIGEDEEMLTGKVWVEPDLKCYGTVYGRQQPLCILSSSSIICGRWLSAGQSRQPMWVVEFEFLGHWWERYCQKFKQAGFHIPLRVDCAARFW